MRESLDLSVMRCRPNSEGFCASFCNWVNSLREAEWHGLRSIQESNLTRHTDWKSSPVLSEKLWNSRTGKTNKQNVHQQPSLSGLPSLGKGGHCASEGTLWRQVTTTGPYGSLTTGNTATKKGNLERDRQYI